MDYFSHKSRTGASVVRMSENSTRLVYQECSQSVSVLQTNVAYRWETGLRAATDDDLLGLR